MSSPDALIKQALMTVCKNVSRLYYKGKASTFITFQLVTGSEVHHTDDDNEGREYSYRFDIYSKKDYTELVHQSIAALKAVGFYGAYIDPEVYENDTGYYHIPVEIKYFSY